MGFSDKIAQRITPIIAEAVTKKLSELTTRQLKDIEGRITTRMLEWDKKMRETVREIVLDELDPLIEKKVKEALKGGV